MLKRDECPHCRAGLLRPWQELSDEEQEVVKRLPASANYSLEERTARHRWCARCWYEDPGHEPQEV